jgi:hypothetical protein
MRLIRPIAAASLAVAAIFVAVTSGHATPRHSLSTDTPDFLRYYRLHDDTVVTELSTHSVSGLSAAQKVRRTALLAELHAYGQRGAFPHNYDFPGQLVPYFVDPKTGALCAVANLLAFSGRRDIVDRVERANNHVWVHELAADTAFRGWLTGNGLTLDEAARIQLPSQTSSGPSPAQMAAIAGTAGVVSLGVVSGLAIASIWNATGNSDGHLGKVSKLGMASGVIASAVGAAFMNSSSARQVGMYTLGAGLTSMALSARSMHNRSVVVAAQEAEKQRSLALSVAPVVSADKGGSAGMSMSVKF